MSERILKSIASLGFLGHSSIAPGTTGCLGALAVYLLIKANILLKAAAVLVFVAVGFLISGRAEALYG